MRPDFVIEVKLYRGEVPYSSDYSNRSQMNLAFQVSRLPQVAL